VTGSRLSSLSVKVTELSGGFAVADADEVAGTVSGVPADLIPAVVYHRPLSLSLSLAFVVSAIVITSRPFAKRGNRNTTR